MAVVGMHVSLWRGYVELVPFLASVHLSQRGGDFDSVTLLENQGPDKSCVANTVSKIVGFQCFRPIVLRKCGMLLIQGFHSHSHVPSGWHDRISSDFVVEDPWHIAHVQVCPPCSRVPGTPQKLAPQQIMHGKFPETPVFAGCIFMPVLATVVPRIVGQVDQSALATGVLVHNREVDGSTCCPQLSCDIENPLAGIGSPGPCVGVGDINSRLGRPSFQDLAHGTC